MTDASVTTTVMRTACEDATTAPLAPAFCACNAISADAPSAVEYAAVIASTRAQRWNTRAASADSTSE